MKKIILLFIMIVLSSFVSAEVYICDNFTSDTSSLFVCGGGNSVAWSSNFGGIMNFTIVDSDGCYWNMSSTITKNFTIVMNESVIIPNGVAAPHGICDANTPVGSYCAGVNGDGYAIGYNTEAADRFYSYNGENIYGNAFSNNVWYNWIIFVNATSDHAELYIDGSLEFATTPPGSGTMDEFGWFGWVSIHAATGTRLVSSFCIADTIDECSICLAPLPDLAPPTLSNPICTSCVTGTNNTVDTTPTINITCTDDTGCLMVRIANNSAFNFANATSTRNCTAGSGGVFVCTLPTIDKLTDTSKETELYFWANDTTENYHTVYNLTINLTYIIDITAPIISNLTNTSTDNDSSVIQWTTNEDTNYTLLWYNSTVLIGNTNVTTFTTSYNPILSNLLNATTYFINLTVYDRAGNSAVNKTFNFTTAKSTPPIPDEVSTLSSSNIELGFNSTNFLVTIKNITNNNVVFDIGSISSDLTFIAFSYDGINLTTYLNGVQTSSRRLNATIDLDNIFLGQNQLENKFFNGTIDEVSIYNRDLNSSEINDLYIYRNRIPISNSSFTSLLNLEANTTRRINCTLDLINISQTYVNWSSTKSNADWSFNYTINVTKY